MQPSRPADNYERLRFVCVAAIHTLTVAALWGQWSRIAILVGLGAIIGAANSRMYRWARDGRRVERVDDIKNTFNALAVVACGHFCGWPLPLWLFLPMNALWLAAPQKAGRWKLAAQVIIVALPALVDGVPLLTVGVFALLCAIVFYVAQARDGMIALRTAELRRANAALAEAEAVARVGSFSIEVDSGRQVWSEQLLRTFGLGSVPAVGQFFEYVHQDDRQLLRGIIDQAKRDGLPFALEYRIVRPDGQVRWLDSRGQCAEAADGSGPRLSGTAQDITDKKAMQARLLLNDRLASLGTLAGGIAHEINNPLAYVIANLDFVSEELRGVQQPVSPALLQELDVVLGEARQGADRVRCVVRDLRSFARDDETTGAVSVSANLAEVLDFATKMASSEIRHRALLVNDVPPLPAVAASPSRLGQLFLNLLVNAAQSIPEGNVEANRVRLSAALDERGRVVVTVADTGCGMPPHVQATIFDPFFSTKPVGSGMGLGLSICHSIVRDFNGEISVVSEVGKGSCFRVVIPVAAAASIVAAPPAGVATLSPRGHVLIVDDDTLVSAALQRILSAAHDVEVVHRAEDALARLSVASFDLVLCDLLMPEMTGMDFHERLAVTAPDVAARVVFMTGGAFTPRAREFLERVPNQRIDKPIDAPWLRTFVAETVTRRAHTATWELSGQSDSS